MIRSNQVMISKFISCNVYFSDDAFLILITEITGTCAEKARTGAEQEPPSTTSSAPATVDAVGSQPGRHQRFVSSAQILHTNIQTAAADAAF